MRLDDLPSYSLLPFVSVLDLFRLHRCSRGCAALVTDESAGINFLSLGRARYGTVWNEITAEAAAAFVDSSAVRRSSSSSSSSSGSRRSPAGESDPREGTSPGQISKWASHQVEGRRKVYLSKQPSRQGQHRTRKTGGERDD